VILENARGREVHQIIEHKKDHGMHHANPEPELEQTKLWLNLKRQHRYKQAIEHYNLHILNTTQNNHMYSRNDQS
jgi:hypothetical protein